VVRRIITKPGEDDNPELDIKSEGTPEPELKPEAKPPEPVKEPELTKKEVKKRIFTAAEKTASVCVVCGDKKATGIDGKPKCPSNNSECPYLS
jgi:hypothetical protein